MKNKHEETENRESFLYLRIYQDILSKIKNGTLSPGVKIPTEGELREYYQVSRDTVRKALQKLTVEGYLARKPSVGTFVKTKKADYSLVRMKSFSEMMHDRRLTPSSEILAIEILKTAPVEVAGYLELNPQDRVYKIIRIRKADGIPMALEYAFIPETICPNLHTHILEDSSLYDIYETQYRLELGEASMELEAELPSTTTQSILKIKANEPILKMLCVMYLKNGSPLYYVECDYVGSRYVFTTKLSR